MPYGLACTPNVLQYLINYILQDTLTRFVIVYTEDILIYSPSLEVHIQQESTSISATWKSWEMWVSCRHLWNCPRVMQQRRHYLTSSRPSPLFPFSNIRIPRSPLKISHYFNDKPKLHSVAFYSVITRGIASLAGGSSPSAHHIHGP